ncbi:ankyrin repeat domain-containing protein [Rummeliibacillus suwonensis]|uniref:ankyrin repeat domain-containing protein n=1 Tax=Rummeliibacillus suwonensis TaxID=1306154 RepID=UPI0011B71081|nr:ankyrin repeat domain-containing protein [Rummeliibacillus suwonensis]MBO2536844.1 ankyrin repeat domain-containing protein [Rummeliibacillus suwonensis]
MKKSHKAAMIALSLGFALVGYTKNKDAKQTLLNAVHQQDLHAVKKLIRLGENLDQHNDRGRTPLMIATYNNDIEIAKVLISNGADVNIPDDMQNTPFLYAAAEGYWDILKLTTKAGADPNITNRYGNTALISAAEHGNVEALRWLLNETKVDVNHINNLGWTALLEAIILGDGSKNYQQCVQLLLQHKANPNIADKDDVTPIEHAEKLGYKEIEYLLKKYGY